MKAETKKEICDILRQYKENSIHGLLLDFHPDGTLDCGCALGILGYAKKGKEFNEHYHDFMQSLSSEIRMNSTFPLYAMYVAKLYGITNNEATQIEAWFEGEKKRMRVPTVAEFLREFDEVIALIEEFIPDDRPRINTAPLPEKQEGALQHA